MNRLISLACASAAAWTIATPALSADFEVAFDLPTGTVIHIDMDKNAELEKSGQNTKFEMKFRYRQDVVATDEGYIVTQTLTESQVLPPEAQPAAGVLTAAKKIVFQADADMSPIQILQLDELVAAVSQAMTQAMRGSMSEDQIKAASGQIQKMYGAMSPEVAANAFLREYALLVAPQMMSLELGKPLGGDMEQPNPFGGPGTVKRTQFYELKSIEKKAGRAVIELRDELDPESLKSIVPSLLARLAPDAPKPTAEQIASVKIEQKTTCRYEMDVKTGLTAKADCTISRGAVGEDGQPNRRVEHIVMTQRLELP